MGAIVTVTSMHKSKLERNVCVWPGGGEGVPLKIDLHLLDF